jgi:hypothetical protein
VKAKTMIVIAVAVLMGVGILGAPRVADGVKAQGPQWWEQIGTTDNIRSGNITAPLKVRAGLRTNTKPFESVCKGSISASSSCKVSCPRGMCSISNCSGNAVCRCGILGNAICECITAIDLLSFTTQAAADHVTLAWETGSEVDNAGFNLHRATSADGPYTKLNDALIPAEGDPESGASYTYTDTDVLKGASYYYKLEDVDVHGVSTFHGPVSATPGRIHLVYLPLVLK